MDHGAILRAKLMKSQMHFIGEKYFQGTEAFWKINIRNDHNMFRVLINSEFSNQIKENLQKRKKNEKKKRGNISVF